MSPVEKYPHNWATVSKAYFNMIRFWFISMYLCTEDSLHCYMKFLMVSVGIYNGVCIIFIHQKNDTDVYFVIQKNWFILGLEEFFYKVVKTSTFCDFGQKIVKRAGEKLFKSLAAILIFERVRSLDWLYPGRVPKLRGISVLKRRRGSTSLSRSKNNSIRRALSSLALAG